MTENTWPLKLNSFTHSLTWWQSPGCTIVWVVLEAMLLSELFLCCFPSYDDHCHLTTLIWRALCNPLKHTASFVFQDEFLQTKFFWRSAYQLDILKTFPKYSQKTSLFCSLAKKCPFCHWIHLTIFSYNEFKLLKNHGLAFWLDFRVRCA